MKQRELNGYTKIRLFLFIVCYALALTCLGQHISNGVLDARHLDLSSGIQLNGRWKFAPNQIVAPTNVRWHSFSNHIVPGLWDNHEKSDNITHGTYYLDVLISDNSTPLALGIPQLYNSYRIFVDDSLVAVNGVPGITKDTSVPHWKPQYVTFLPKRDTVNIIIHVSGFHHYQGGIREPILFGSVPAIQSNFNSKYISTLVETGTLVILAIFFVYIWRCKKKNPISIYFALFCLSWSVREMFSDIYPVSHLVSGINWFLMVRVEYISLFLIVIFAVLFMNRLFADLGSKVFQYMMIGGNAIFILLTIFTPTDVFTKWLPLYLIAAGITLIYASVLTIRAVILDKTGAWPLTAGLLLMVISSAYDLIAYKGMIVNNILVGNVAYIVILSCCAVGLLQHLDIVRWGSNADDTLRYQDLYR